MKVFNGTAHPIHLIEGAEYREDIRAYVGGRVTVTFLKRTMLSAGVSSVPVGKIGCIRFFDKKFGDITPIPEGYDVVIVSAMYAQIARDAGIAGVDKLYTICDPVFEDDGTKSTHRGCRGLMRPMSTRQRESIMNRLFTMMFPNYWGTWFSFACSVDHQVYVVDCTFFGLVVQCWRTDVGKSRELPWINVWRGVRRHQKEETA